MGGYRAQGTIRNCGPQILKTSECSQSTFNGSCILKPAFPYSGGCFATFVDDLLAEWAQQVQFQGAMDWWTGFKPKRTTYDIYGDGLTVTLLLLMPRRALEALDTLNELDQSLAATVIEHIICSRNTSTSPYGGPTVKLMGAPLSSSLCNSLASSNTRLDKSIQMKIPQHVGGIY